MATDPDFLEWQAAQGQKSDSIDPDFLEWQSAQGQEAYSPKISQIGKGLTFGFFDELQGLESGASNAISNLFGRGNDKGFWGNYQNTVDSIRSKDTSYEKENPWTATGLQLTGGLLPSILSGGAPLAGVGANTTKTVAPNLLKYLYGIGINEAPTVGQLVKIGATGGALAGAGEANDGSRLLGAGLGGITGGIAAPVIGKTLGYASNSILDALTNSGVKQRLSSQTGAIGNLGSPKASYTPEELVLARKLKEASSSEVDNAIEELTKTIQQDVPLFLPEALNSPNVTRNARFIANFEPSLKFSQNTINERAKSAPTRTKSLLSLLSPEDSPFDGAKKLITGASDILEEAKNQRADLAKPAYQKAYDVFPRIEQQEKLYPITEEGKTLLVPFSGLSKSSQARKLALELSKMEGVEEISKGASSSYFKLPSGKTIRISDHDPKNIRSMKYDFNISPGSMPDNYRLEEYLSLINGGGVAPPLYNFNPKKNAFDSLYSDDIIKLPDRSPDLFVNKDLRALLDKDKVLTQVISNIKKTANNADLPENSTSLLVKARQEIGNKIDNAITQGRGREAADLTDTYNRLNNILHTSNPLLKEADSSFATASKEIEALSDTFLSSLSRISDDKVTNIKSLFNLSPNRINGLKTQFEKSGKSKEWEAGIRAYIQNIVEGVNDNGDFTKKLISNESSREKLRAALGDKADPIIEGLKLEARMFEGKNKYFTGSSTATNLEEAQSTKSFIQKIKGMASVDGLMSLVFKDGLPDDVAQGLAKIYFDPKSGLNSLEKIKPLLKSYAQNKLIASNLTAGSGSTITKTNLVNDLLNSNIAEAASQEASQISPKQTNLLPSLSALEKSKTQGLESPESALPLSQKRQRENSSLKKQGTVQEKLKGKESSSIESSRANSPYKPISYNDTETTPYNFIDLALNRAISQIDDADLQKTLPKGKKMTGDIDLDALKKAVITQESAGNSKAVSPKGAQGLMQLMPATGKELAKEIGVKYDPYDPEQNQELGMLYLTKQLKTFGSMELALAAYNAGPGRVKEWQRKYGTTWRQIEQALQKRGSFKETTDYVSKIKKTYETKAKKNTGAIEI